MGPSAVKGAMTSAFRIVIPIATPSLNELLGMHFGARLRLSKKIHIMVALCGHGIPKATSKRHLTIERHGKRQLDKDNLYGGAKLLIDVLKKRGMITDDSPEHVELEVTQVKLSKGEHPYTVVILGE